MLIPNKNRLSFYDKLYLGDAANMKEIPNNSIQLIFTSPPYFEAKKEYQSKDQTLQQYLSILKLFIDECNRVLITGGRLIINVANVGRNPYISICTHIHQYTEISFIKRGEIIWDKGASAGSSTAWGSWRSASNPSLRDVHEYLLIYSKEDKKRYIPHGKDSITADDFAICTQSIWHINSISAKKRGHPAPFPIELARRVIELYSFVGDIVLDPFMGSGTTMEAAILTNRHYIGYDLVPEYITLSQKYIEESKRRKVERH
jgi:site-specific DNA-methyltransferase (adenine-specific)